MKKTKAQASEKKASKKAAKAKVATIHKASSATGASKTKAGGKKSKTSKTAGQTKPKRLSALDAAAQVLKAAGQPMRATELITTMEERGLWKSPGGKTPSATLYAAMMREARDKGDAARFRKVDRGQFQFN